MRNLNVFIALAALSIFPGGAILAVVGLFVTLPLVGLGVDVSAGLLQTVGTILLLVVLAVKWFRSGLLPRNIDPNRVGRYDFGHTLVFLGNVIIVGATIVVAATLKSNPASGVITPYLFAVALPFCAVLWGTGLLMIISSRGPSR